MKYIITFIWSFLLVTMVNYVAGSIAGIQSFDFVGGIIASIVLAVLILCITAITPDEQVADY
ncbi:DUF2929 family protein [Sporosarcina sp. 179-K 8C2 HS]|uniref:DUF2929 family protein n=1 Tax=Sporosarcina sp. 179-K 8C2 HS TaxID=3142387 RepID=UPI00399F84F1